MRKFFTTVFLFVGITSMLLLLPAYTKKPADDLMKPVDAMMTRVMNIKMSDNFDRDFINLMNEHHQVGADLSKIMYKYDRTNKIGQMAKVSYVTQEKEQKEMKEILGHLPETYDQKTEDKGTSRNELLSAINKMVEQMKNVKLTNDLEGNYSDLMIIHHQAGIEMANAELKHGKNDEARQMATRMLDECQKDFNELKNWQENRNSVSQNK